MVISYKINCALVIPEIIWYFYRYIDSEDFEYSALVIYIDMTFMIILELDKTSPHSLLLNALEIHKRP